MVSIFPPISNFSSLFLSLLGMPMTIGITVIFIFHGFLSFLARSKYLSLIWFSLIWDGKVQYKTSQDLVISKYQRISVVLFSKPDSGLCIYHLLVWSNVVFFHNSQWITFSKQLCLVLYSVCYIRLLMVSSLSSHNLLLLFWCAL